MRHRTLAVAATLVLTSVLGLVQGRRVLAGTGPADTPQDDTFAVVRPVAGTGVHYLSTAIVHSKEWTDTGVLIQRSTETVELQGDLTGRILYHPTTVIDPAAGTLVNTGHQVFSGTVLGSEPAVLHDDQFRFEVDLVTGQTRGEVYLTEVIAGPKVRCWLRVVGAGVTPEGNALGEYTGECRFKDN